MKAKIGVISDLHLFNKTANIKRALTKLYGSDLVLIVRDLADRADEKQYEILLGVIGERLHSNSARNFRNRSFGHHQRNSQRKDFYGRTYHDLRLVLDFHRRGVMRAERIQSKRLLNTFFGTEQPLFFFGRYD